MCITQIENMFQFGEFIEKGGLSFVNIIEDKYFGKEGVKRVEMKTCCGDEHADLSEEDCNADGF